MVSGGLGVYSRLGDIDIKAYDYWFLRLNPDQSQIGSVYLEHKGHVGSEAHLRLISDLKPEHRREYRKISAEVSSAIKQVFHWKEFDIKRKITYIENATPPKLRVNFIPMHEGYVYCKGFIEHYPLTPEAREKIIDPQLRPAKYDQVFEELAISIADKLHR